MKHLLIQSIAIAVFYCYPSFADSLPEIRSTDTMSNCTSIEAQLSEPFHKRVHVQYLLGAGAFDFPDFNTDFAIHGHKPGYRPGLSLGVFPRVVLNKAFFLDPGLRIIHSSGRYQELNTEGQAISYFDGLTWTKVMLHYGFGTGIHTSQFALSIRAGIIGDFSVTTRKSSIGNDGFFSFGIGGDVSTQLEIFVTPRIGIPLRIGYGSSESTPVRRFIAIWSKHWYDYITKKDKTQKYNGPYVMSGIICCFGKSVF